MTAFVPEDPNKAINQPQSGEIKVSAGNYRYAGFWIRFLAVFIDGIILGVIGAIIFGVDVGAVSTYSISRGGETVLNLIYTVAFWSFLGATPGKMICGLKIIRTDGKSITFLQALGRYFAYILSAIPFCLGFIWAAYDSKKQAWHDMLAGTYVVKK